MQVFKAFLRVINRHKGQMIMYLCIFSGLLSAFVFSAKKDDNSYTSTKANFAVFDYDNTPESQALVDYLTEKQNLKKISADEKEAIQDALFIREVDCVLRVNEGYGKGVKAGETGYLEVLTIPDTYTSVNFENTVNEYESMLDAYITAGYEAREAIAKTQDVLSKDVEVLAPEGKTVETRSDIKSFFTYLGWVILVMAINGISPVLQVFMRKDLKNRIECSSYNFLRFNKELFLGVICTGLIICGTIIVIFNVLLPGKMFSLEAGLMIANMLCYTLFSLAMAFLISKVTSNEQVISMIANVTSLGMAFLCGVFVPMELLSEGVLKIAHFLPAYWYCIAINTIEENVLSNVYKILGCFGIELLFAIAIAVVALVVDRKRIK